MPKQNINRYKWTENKIRQVKSDIKSGKQTKLLKEFHLDIQGSYLSYEGKKIIPTEDVDSYLMKELKNGAPLSIEQMFWWVYPKAWGISRRAIAKWMKSQSNYQMLKSRPAHNTRRNIHRTEGATSWVTDHDNFPNALGADLFVIPNSWSKWTNLLVVVHKKSRYTFAEPIMGATAKATRTAFRRIYIDCLANFGHPGAVFVDAGSEFFGEFHKFLREKGIQKRVLKLVSWVENKNSQLGRYIAWLLKEGVGWRKSLSGALEKINNTKSRITGQRASDIYNGIVPSNEVVQRHRKLAKVPKHRAIKPLPVTTKESKSMARFLNAPAQRKKDQFYKQYVGAKRKGAARMTNNWSAPAKITKRKKWGDSWKYMVDGKWRVHSDLQGISKVVAPKRKQRKRYVKKKKPMKLRSGKVLV